MKPSNEIIDSIQKLHLRIDDIEKLLNLLLINNLIDGVENVIQDTIVEIDSDVETFITQFGLEIEGFLVINEIEVMSIIIPSNSKVSIKDLKKIYFFIKNAFPDKEPFFLYQTINGMQRKRLMQESISFGVIGKEMHVFNGGGKRK